MYINIGGRLTWFTFFPHATEHDAHPLVCANHTLETTVLNQNILLAYIDLTAFGFVTTQPRIQWAPGLLHRWQSCWGVKLTTCLHIMPRSRMCGAIPPVLHTPV
jgi:hypothetical protein